MSERRPVLIMGAERSGTTLLRLILDVHPHIAIGPESGFLRAVHTTLDIPNWNFGANWFERFGIERPDMVRRLADLYDGIFSEYAAGRGKRRWGDKTPLHRWLAGLADELYPEAQFIGIVRHPGAMCLSRARWGYDLSANVKMWNLAAHLLTADRDRFGPERYRIIRYEDLVRSPEPVLRGIVDFLGEPWSEDLLRHHEIHAEREEPEVTDGGTRTARPIDPSALDAWLEEADDGDIAAVAEGTSPWRERFGYTDTGVLPDSDAPALRHRGIPDLPPPPVLRPREELLERQIGELQSEVEEARARAEAAEAEAARLRRITDRRFVRVGRLLLDGSKAPRDLLSADRWREALEKR